MEYVRVGRSGLRVSRVGLGAMAFGSSNWRNWVLDEKEALPIVARALELGINFFDTSDFYSLGESERVLGRILGGLASREDIVIATKVGNPMSDVPNRGGYSRKHIMAAVDASLRRLNVDYIDLYQTHIWDESADMEEMVSAFDDLIRLGKVLYVGATDMPAWQFAKMLYASMRELRTSFVSMQGHYNLLWREDEREMLPLCASEGVGLLPYSPLARGYLAVGSRGLERDTRRAKGDEYARSWYGRKADERVADAVSEVARQRGCSAASVALSWILTKWPTATPIFGATRLGHVDVAVDAAKMRLEESEVEELERAYLPRLRSGHV